MSKTIENTYNQFSGEFENLQITSLQEKIVGSEVNMLIILTDKKERLLKFDTSDDIYTIEDLLKEANIDLNKNITVQLVLNSSLTNIDYLISIEEPLITKKQSLAEVSFQSNIHDKKKKSRNMKKKISNLISEIEKNLGYETSKKKFKQIADKIASEIKYDSKLQAIDGKTDKNKICKIEHIDTSKVSSFVSLNCHTIRIGSYKFVPTKSVTITTDVIKFDAPLLEDEDMLVSVELKQEDVEKILADFGKLTPTVFIYTNTISATLIREKIGMFDSDGLYFDPDSTENSQRRIILLPDKVRYNAKKSLIKIFGSKIKLFNQTTNKTPRF